MKSLLRLCTLVLVLVVLGAACGNDDVAEETAPVAETETPEPEDPTEQDPGVEEEVDEPVQDEPTVQDTPEPEEPMVRPTVSVGAVSSLSGPFAFTDASASAAAVFDQYNSNPDGLVTIEYIVEDDAADPSISAQVARKLVDSDGVAMMAGSAGLADCNVNSAFYEENGIYSVPGTGVPDACFTSPNTEPVNAGASLAFTTALYFMSEVLGNEAICVFRFNAGNPSEPSIAAAERWTAITGKTLLIHDTYAPGEDFTPLVTKAQEAGCTAVFEGGLEFTAIAWDQAVAAQGATFETVHFPSAYTENAASVIGTPASDTYSASEFVPFTDVDSPDLVDWFDAMNAADLPITALAQAGYLSALIAIDILEAAGLEEGDDSDTQRAKIGEAIPTMAPFENPMLGEPYVFGSSAAGTRSSGMKFVQLVDERWVTATDDFINIANFE